MGLLIATSSLAYFVDAFFVGVLLSFCRLRYQRNFSNWVFPFGLLALFVFLDTYWLPAIVVLDAQIEIGNAHLATALGASGKILLVDLLSIGWLNVLIWGAQVVVAVWIADRFVSSTNTEEKPI